MDNDDLVRELYALRKRVARMETAGHAHGNYLVVRQVAGIVMTGILVSVLAWGGFSCAKPMPSSPIAEVR